MKITKELMRETFAHFNKLIWDNSIWLEPTFKVYNSKINCGYFIGEPDEEGKPTAVIKLSKYYNKTYQDFCETLVHEMVHLYQYINKMPVEHDKAFNMMAKIIKRGTGLEIR